MPASKGRATAYSDYFKNNTNTPSGAEDDNQDVPQDVAARRKAALQRRLKMRRGNFNGSANTSGR
jgi:hypothetical protein